MRAITEFWETDSFKRGLSPSSTPTPSGRERRSRKRPVRLNSGTLASSGLDQRLQLEFTARAQRLHD